MFDGWYDRSKRPNAQVTGEIPTSQVAWELNALVEIYASLPPYRVLEIGSQDGGTLRLWLEHARPGALVINIDILQNQPQGKRIALPAHWHNWARECGVKLHTIIRRSDDPETIQMVRSMVSRLDFLFIDGLHTYEGAKADFINYGPLVRPGGIIALHDLITPIHQQHIQVGKLWREIQAAGYMTKELRAQHYSGWGGIGVVYV